MKTENIISQDVKIIRIVNLKKWDLIKMMVKAYSGYETQYALVLDVYMNWDNTFVEVIKYTNSYSEFKCEYKVYTNWDDLNIFPATIDEVEWYFNNTVQKIEETIEWKEQEIIKLKSWLDKAKQFISWELQKEIREAEFMVYTQDSYKEEQKRIEKEELLKKASEL